MEYIQGDIREKVNSLHLTLRGCLNLDTHEIFGFAVLDGPNDLSEILPQLNRDLYERLQEKMRLHLVDLAKPEGVDL